MGIKAGCGNMLGYIPDIDPLKVNASDLDTKSSRAPVKPGAAFCFLVEGAAFARSRRWVLIRFIQ